MSGVRVVADTAERGVERVVPARAGRTHRQVMCAARRSGKRRWRSAVTISPPFFPLSSCGFFLHRGLCFCGRDRLGRPSRRGRGRTPPPPAGRVARATVAPAGDLCSCVDRRKFSTQQDT